MKHIIALLPFKQFEETFLAIMDVIQKSEVAITIVGNIEKADLSQYPFVKKVIYIPNPEIYKDDMTPFFDILDACYEEHPFSAIINFFEEYVEMAAKITRRYNLYGNSEETAHLTRNKFAMRKALAAHGIKVPQFIKVSDFSQFEAAVNTIGFPCVVKPLDAMASEGVIKLEKVEDFELLYNDIVATNKRVAKTTSTDILVEQYIKGPEISWEAVVAAGQLHVMGITEKTTEDEPFFNEIMHIHPALLDDVIQEKIHETGVKAVAALGIQFGGIHMEARISSGEVYIMEIASRLGGDGIPTLMNLSKGYEPYAYVFKSGLNEEFQLKQTRHKYAGIRFIQAHDEGELKEIYFDEEKLSKIPGVISKRIFGKVGEFIARPPKGRTNRLAYLTIAGRDYDTVKKELLNAENCLKYVIE
jgi:S-sulfo-L-cysteine synthase (3-phospho-L-serine-dependent)